MEMRYLQVIVSELDTTVPNRRIWDRMPAKRGP